MQAGDPVLVLSGPFASMEGVIVSTDPAGDLIAVDVNVLGRSVRQAFPLSRSTEHVTPFRDQPPVHECPNRERRLADLLSPCSAAEATYCGSCSSWPNLARVQIIKSAAETLLLVSTLNITEPIRQSGNTRVVKKVLSSSHWSEFSALVEASGFWRMPFDDGRRVSRRGEHCRWWLEGYADIRYHAVERQSSSQTSDIAECFDYLARLAGILR